MARCDQRLAVTSDIWDKNPFLLGTPGGVIDLSTGQLARPRPEDYMTKSTTVAPAESDTPCPIFDKFLDEATAGDPGLKRFILQFSGYCLTGSTKEQELLFIYGPGGNGKSVLQTVVSDILGDYAKTAPMETFAASKHQRHLTELAMLAGARLVAVSETEKGQAWSESRVNAMTGGDKITANFMRQDHFTYVPEFKIMVVGNNKPQIQSVNAAARRRFNIIPFEHQPKEPDKMLGTKLKSEYPAILRRLIDGCLDWQANGFVKPKVVLEATREYFEEQDLFGRWLEERCELGPNLVEKVSALYHSWQKYAEQNGEMAQSSKVFSSMLHERGFTKHKSGVVHYQGVRLKELAEVDYSCNL